MRKNPGLPSRVLFIDDNLIGFNEIKGVLEKQDITVLNAPDYSSALYIFNKQNVDVTMVSMELKELSGLSVLQKLKGSEDITKKSAGIILMSSKRERSVNESNLMKEYHGVEVIPKPFKGVQLLPYLQRAYKIRGQDIKYEELKANVVDFHRKTGNYEKAIAAVKKQVPELGARGPQLLMELYQEANMIDEALVLVDALIGQNPDQDDIKLINMKAQFHMKKGELDEAKKLYEKADELAPKNLKRMQEMANLYLEMNEPDKSVEKMKGLCDESPEAPDLKFDMFTQLSDKGYSQHAIDYCRESTTATEVVKFYNNRGVMSSKEGNYLEAIAKYDEALQFYPEHKENYRIYWNIAIATVNGKEDGYKAKAIENLKKVLELNPDFEKATALLDKLQNPPKKAIPSKKKSSDPEAS